MLRDAFTKGLRDQARPLLMWVVGVAFYVGLLMSIYPSIKGSASPSRGTSTACRRLYVLPSSDPAATSPRRSAT